MSDIARLLAPLPIPLKNPQRDDSRYLFVDLNSCFATIEQQARPMLRNRPIAITNRITKNACIIAASYEAKAKGVKVGMRRQEAEQLCPKLIFAETEPAKFIYVHHKLRTIMQEYSSHVVMKSIDEGVIDLKAAPLEHKNRPAADIGREIKVRLKNEIGCHMRCNIGIGANRFLAKLAAELHKPDGLDHITAENQREIFKNLKLLDLPGINKRMQRRLNAVNIFTPLDFLDADEKTLVHFVNHSIDGSKWYRRLRGVEVDDIDSDIKSIGRQYVLESNSLSKKEINARLINLAEDLGQRLRSKNLYARGVYLWILTHSDLYLHANNLRPITFRTTRELLQEMQLLTQKLPLEQARTVGITLYKLTQTAPAQLSFDQAQKDKADNLCQALDQINRRFGDRHIHLADSLGTGVVKVKIPFGSTRFL